MTTSTTDNYTHYDTIIVGSGLAGLTVALELLDSGRRVVILEKEPKFGCGNSIKASSGINAVHEDDNNNGDNNGSQDSIDAFRHDTTISAGKGAKPHLIDTLVQNSSAAYQWLTSYRIHANLDQATRLGGHSNSRTHRPGSGSKMPVGAEIMIKLQACIKEYLDKGQATILVQAKATKLQSSSVADNEASNCSPSFMYTLEYEQTTTTTHDDKDDDKKKDDKTTTTKGIVQSNHVVLATGGYASDRSEHSLLAKYRPELQHFPATAGEFSTGDGIALALSSSGMKNNVKPKLVDMEQIQIHPTGFVDPNDPTSPNKFLAAEVLRGVGGILLDKHGQRFCNELGRRDYITDQMLALSHPEYTETKEWKAEYELPQAYLVLGSDGAKQITKHMDFYSWKGLLQKCDTLEKAANVLEDVSSETLVSTLMQYQTDCENGTADAFGKTVFPSRILVPPSSSGDENNKDDNATLYIGKVTPVLHYCMGGLSINSQAQVLDTDGHAIPGLYACGEAAGGVHGHNRLAGNSLLECVVYGRIAAQSILEATKTTTVDNKSNNLK